MNEFENSQISGFFQSELCEVYFFYCQWQSVAKATGCFFFVLLHISGIDRIGMETKWLQNNDRVISSA